MMYQFVESRGNTMEDAVITRLIDEFGRVTVPMSMRKALGLHPLTPIQIRIQGDSIVIRKHSDSCVFCSSDIDLTEFKGRFVCAECLRQLDEK